MKTVIARLGNDQPVVVDLPRPTVGPGQVRVTVVAAAFTYFDAFLPTVQGALGLPEQVGLGFDFAGTVTEVGTDVTGFAIGDRVAGLHVDISAPTRAHAEEVVIDADALALVPAGIELDVAAAVPLSALTARQALDLLGPERGTLLVTGAAGAVGGWLVELAGRDGWDVTALVKPGTEDLVTAATTITAIDTKFDAVADAAALHEAALAAVRDGGRYVGFKPGQPQTPERGITASTIQVQPDGPGLAALFPLADSVVPVRIAGRGTVADVAEVYRRAWDGSGSRGRWVVLP